MKNEKEKIRNKYWFKAFWACFIVAAVCIVPILIKDKGLFVLSNDFNAETIPFTMFINDAIKSGEVIWNYNIDIGSNFLEALSGFFSSPFMLFQFLFPADWFPYLIGWIIIIKYSVAGVTSSLFLKRHISNEKIVVIGAMLYSFSSFGCTTILFQFQDVIAMFPLMLFTLELLVEENKKAPFVWATVLNICCSFTNFIGVSIFTFIYYLFKYFIPSFEKKNTIKTIKDGVNTALCAILAAGTSAVVVVPTVINLLGNTRAGEKLAIDNWFYSTTTYLLLYIKSFFFPAEPMNAWYTVSQSDWMTCAAYIPIFGVTLALAYAWTKKDWLARLTVFLMLAAYVQVLNNSFYLLSAAPYHRWFYMIDIILALVTCKVLENMKEYKVTRSCVVTLLVIAFFVYLVFIVDYWGNGSNLVYRDKKATASVLYAIGGVIVCLAIRYVEKLKTINWKTISLVGVFCVAQLGNIIIEYRTRADNTMIDFNSYEVSYSEAVVNYLTDVAKELDADTGQYRYYIDENIGYTYYNIGMTNSLPTINSFVSMCSNSIFDFYDSIGSHRSTNTVLDSQLIIDLLGAKYVVTQDVNFQKGNLVDSIVNGNGDTFYVYENNSALPIGVTYDSYITKSEFESIDTIDGRVAAMCTALVVDEENSEIVAELKHYDGEINQESLLNNYGENIEERQKRVCENFEKKRNSFSMTYSTDKTEYVFISMPFEKWWKATVNGKAEDVINVNGLMAVRVDSGYNEIVFEYDYLPIKVAMVISLSSLVIAIFITVAEYKKRSSKE